MFNPSVVLVLILSLLLGLQPLTTDLYLPALPFITKDLQSTFSMAQLTLSTLLMAFGVSQLVWGPLSDRFGRRPILLTGLVLYVFSAISATLANTMEVLIGFRIIQGVALGAAVMCARTMVRDLFDDPVLGAKVMSQGLTGLGVIACLSTPIGGVLTALFGWRSTLLALAVIGAATLAVVAFQLDETLTDSRRETVRIKHLSETWRSILSDPVFWSYSLFLTASFGGLYVFLAASSFVFIETLGFTTPIYGLIMFTMSAFYIGGTILCRWLLLRFSIQRTVIIGAGFSLLGGSTMALSALAGWHNFWGLTLPFYIFMIGHGINQPCAQSGVMGPFPHAAGTASALNAFVMTLGSFVVGFILGLSMNNNTVFPLAFGIFFSGLTTALVVWGMTARAPRQAKCG